MAGAVSSCLPLRTTQRGSEHLKLDDYLINASDRTIPNRFRSDLCRSQPAQKRSSSNFRRPKPLPPVSVPKQKSDGAVVGDETENVILEFKPRPKQDMLVACLWSHWTGPGEPELDSFAAITDEPPTEVSDAGHDRCIIPIKPEHVDAWLNPNPKNLKATYEILDDRERPYYEHRLAA